MKLKYISIFVLYSAFLYGLSQEEINKLALEAEAQMAVAGPVGELNARNFLKGQGITNSSDINAIINLALQIKNDSKLKVKLAAELEGPKKEEDLRTLSVEEINSWALKAEPKMKGAGGEILVRNYLKQEGIIVKKDQDAIINQILEIQKNPRLRIKSGNNNQSKPSKDVVVNLSEEEINSWAKKAQAKMVGPMGEFAARKFLKEQGITNKADLDAIINKIIELQKTLSQQPSNIIKPIQKIDFATSKGESKGVEISPEVEKWAKELRAFDPEAQTFKILKTLKDGNVDKGLYSQILSRIRELRLQKKDDSGKGREINVSGEKEIPLEKFDDLEKKVAIQEMITWFTLHQHILFDFIKIMEFKITNRLDVLWQDLVLYFYFTALERPSKPGQEQSAYDWVLRHTHDDIYKGY